MYALVILLSLVATACFLHAFVFRRRSTCRCSRSRSLLLVYTHNWGLFFGAGDAGRACAHRRATAATDAGS